MTQRQQEAFNADRDANRDAVRRGHVRKEHRERIEACHGRNARTAGARKQRLR